MTSGRTPLVAPVPSAVPNAAPNVEAGAATPGVSAGEKQSQISPDESAAALAPEAQPGAPPQDSDSSLEARRIALEERKWNDELSLRQAELEIKHKEGSWVAKLFSPLTATLFAGIVTIGGSVIATLMQNASTIRIEKEKSDATQRLESQKEQHELILKMVSVGNDEQAKKNLLFLADVGLVDDDTATKIRNAKTTPVLPSATVNVAPSTIPLTPEDLRRLMSDEALQMILSFEAPTQEQYESKICAPDLGGRRNRGPNRDRL